MKKLFARLFKKEPEFDYVIAAYQPIQINRKNLDIYADESDEYQSLETDDEMQIDNIHKGM